MAKKLYLVNKGGYPEDWVIVYASSWSELIEEYCSETGKEVFCEDELYDNYDVTEISHVGSKKIKEIIFED